MNTVSQHPLIRERVRVLPLFLGLTCLLEVNVAGRLMGSDLVCLAGGIYTLFLRSRSKSFRSIQILIGLAFLWLAGAMLTDLMRNTAFDDVARGESRIIVLIAGLYFLGDRAARDISWVACFWFGVVIGLGVKPLLITQYGFVDAPWKFGLGLCTLGVTLIAVERLPNERLARTAIAYLLLTTLAIVSLFSNYRSMFGILIAASMIVAFRRPLYLFVFGRRTNYFALVLLLSFAALGAQTLTWGYARLAENGALGQSAQDKYENQARLGLNAIQSGRQESLVSFQAIKDSPIIGHGSWAKDPKYMTMLIDMLQSYGASIPPSMREVELIPSHSYIFGAWVDHGILSVPFWVAVLVLMGLGIRRSIQPLCPHREAVCVISMLNIWDTLFSPFGAQQRVLVAATCALVAAAIAHPFANRKAGSRASIKQGYNIPRMSSDG